ncbi:MAG: GNAT family N-acetyltransferase [Alphaproteobacteria bacterium]
MHGPAPAWRPMAVSDLTAVMTIQESVHSLLPEREVVFAERLALFPEGAWMLTDAEERLGYAIAYPYAADFVPKIDAVIGALPEPATNLYIHDVALLPVARGRGAGRVIVERLFDVARSAAMTSATLVSVYDSAPFWSAMGFVEISPSPAISATIAGYGGARFMRRQV